MGTIINNRFTRPMFCPVMGVLLRFSLSRRLINIIHNKIKFSDSEVFFWLFVPAFRRLSFNGHDKVEWNIKFGDANISIPMVDGVHSDLAIAMRGHDSTVKQTYDVILNSVHRPKVFVDIGASYGSHSLLMAASGVSVIAFEPNPLCNNIIKSLFRYNNVDIKLHEIAIADCAREVSLIFPSGNTTIGKICDRNIGQSDISRDEVCVDVRQDCIDAQDIPSGHVLMKIDVEGGELNVLKGAGEFVRVRRPWIIFESLENDSTRSDMFALFVRLGYVIGTLPWISRALFTALDSKEFEECSDTNFIALPRDA